MFINWILREKISKLFEIFNLKSIFLKHNILNPITYGNFKGVVWIPSGHFHHVQEFEIFRQLGKVSRRAPHERLLFPRDDPDT